MKNNNYLAKGDFVYRHKHVPIFVKAEGPYLFDEEGKRYFDAEAANGTVGLGFDKTILQEAYKKTEDLPSIPSFCETEIRKKVATRIGKMLQKITGEKGKIAFELGGAQGMELALKIAKCNNRKSQFVVFEGGYHGRSIYTSQFSASHRYRALMGDWRVPIIRLPYPDFDQSGMESREAFFRQSLNYIKGLTEKEVGGMITRTGEPDIVALVIEPILNAGGIVKPDKNFLEEVVSIFRKLGVLIIMDEVFCGFHRTGPMYGFMHYDFLPDIVVMSKAITNGLAPLSAVWARDPLLSPDNFPPGTHSATFINNPITLNIASTVLDRFQNWKNKERDIGKLEKALSKMINQVAEKSKLVKNGYAIGGLGRILLKDNIAGKILDIALEIGKTQSVNGCNGLILASTGMSANVLAINPPLNLTNEQMGVLSKLLLKTFDKAEKIYDRKN